MSCLKPRQDNHGKVIGYIFEPTWKMYRAVVAMADEKNQELDLEEILKLVKVSEKEFESWFRIYIIHEADPEGKITQSINYFKDWWNNQLEITDQNEKQILKRIAIKHALDGKFNYWEAAAKISGLITNEVVQHKHTIIPFELGQGSISNDEFERARQKLLEAHKGVGHEGGTGMARLTTKRSKS